MRQLTDEQKLLLDRVSVPSGAERPIYSPYGYVIDLDGSLT